MTAPPGSAPGGLAQLEGRDNRVPGPDDTVVFAKVLGATALLPGPISPAEANGSAGPGQLRDLDFLDDEPF